MALPVLTNSLNRPCTVTLSIDLPRLTFEISKVITHAYVSIKNSLIEMSWLRHLAAPHVKLHWNLKFYTR